MSKGGKSFGKTMSLKNLGSVFKKKGETSPNSSNEKMEPKEQGEYELRLRDFFSHRLPEAGVSIESLLALTEVFYQENPSKLLGSAKFTAEILTQQKSSLEFLVPMSLQKAGISKQEIIDVPKQEIIDAVVKTMAANSVPNHSINDVVILNMGNAAEKERLGLNFNKEFGSQTNDLIAHIRAVDGIDGSGEIADLNTNGVDSILFTIPEKVREAYDTHVVGNNFANNPGFDGALREFACEKHQLVVSYMGSPCGKLWANDFPKKEAMLRESSKAAPLIKDEKAESLVADERDQSQNRPQRSVTMGGFSYAPAPALSLYAKSSSAIPPIPGEGKPKPQRAFSHTSMSGFQSKQTNGVNGAVYGVAGKLSESPESLSESPKEKKNTRGPLPQTPVQSRNEPKKSNILSQTPPQTPPRPKGMNGTKNSLIKGMNGTKNSLIKGIKTEPPAVDESSKPRLRAATAGSANSKTFSYGSPLSPSAMPLDQKENGKLPSGIKPNGSNGSAPKSKSSEGSVVSPTNPVNRERSVTFVASAPLSSKVRSATVSNGTLPRGIRPNMSGATHHVVGKLSESPESPAESPEKIEKKKTPPQRPVRSEVSRGRSATVSDATPNGISHVEQQKEREKKPFDPSKVSGAFGYFN